MSISDQHLSAVMACATARAAWTYLQTVFEPQIAGRAIKLQRDLGALRMKQEGEPVCSRKTQNRRYALILMVLV